MPRLVLTTGSGQIRQIRLQSHETRIGRDLANDIVVELQGVSRAHACLMVEGTFVSITDMGSTNGTYVNGTRVYAQLLADGDWITIGGCDMQFFAAQQEYPQAEVTRLMTVPALLRDTDSRHPP